MPGAGEVRTYGMVAEAEAVYEGATLESDTHRIAELGIMPASKSAVGACGDPRGSRYGSPPTPGAPWSARPAGRAARRCTPTRCPGRSPSGSGATVPPSMWTSSSSTAARVATCRSAATQRRRHQDLVRVVLPADLTGTSPGVLGEGAANLRVIVFNVKGEDLLWLDRPNALFDERRA